MDNAPIALFTFKRPEHTRRMLESLALNAEFLESPLFVYCDGARHKGEAAQVEETRQLVRDWPHPNKSVTEQNLNCGLANSVIEGVTQICGRFGRVIVVEDDLVVSPVFLNYMNAALVRYFDDNRVMQISAHMFPVTIESDFDAVMMPFTSSWGWATWDRAWKAFDSTLSGYEYLRSNESLRRQFDLNGAYPFFRMLTQQRDRTIDSWAIRWYLSVFLAKGMVLFPKKTLVINGGFDGSGTNCKTPQLRNEVLRVEPVVKFPSAQLDGMAFDEVKSHLATDRLVLNKLFKILRTKWASYRA